MGRLRGRIQAGFGPVAVAFRARSVIRTSNRATILGYHDVLPSPRQSHHISTPVFDRQMERLSRPPFVVEPLSLVVDQKQTSRAHHRVVLTFDDARNNFLEHAFPTLHRLRFPAVLYVPSGLLGAPGHLRPRDIEQLAEEGVEIGSHGRNHRALTPLDQAELEYEVRSSKAELEDILGREVRNFSYPFGDWDARVVEEVRRAGYESAVVVKTGRVSARTDRFGLPRSWPTDSMTLRWFEVLASGYGDLSWLRLPFRRQSSDVPSDRGFEEGTHA